MRVYEFFGGPGTGKSFLCLTLAVNTAIVNKQYVLYIGTQSSAQFWNKRLVSLAARHGEHLVRRALRRIYYAYAPTLDLQFNMVKQALIKMRERKGEIGLLIVDSLIYNFRIDFNLTIGKEMRRRQRRLTRFINKLSEIAVFTEAAVVYTNHVAHNVYENNDQTMSTTACGGIPTHTFPNVRVHMQRVEDCVDEDVDHAARGNAAVRICRLVHFNIKGLTGQTGQKVLIQLSNSGTLDWQPKAGTD